jgi:D-alanyl-D-alanine dipeptidase/kynurenine formamidase
MAARRCTTAIALGAILLLKTTLAQDAPPRELGPFREPDLVEIVGLDATLRLDIRYAGKNNFVGRPLYSEPRAFLQRPAAEALVRVHRALREQGYGLLIFDAYRPWQVTKTFWDLTPPDRRVFVADPSKGSRHNRGCAVDLSLFDLRTGREVEMPGGYDEMSERSYATFGGGSEQARAHREVLRNAMEREGFFVFPYEWWHFDYKDWREYPILNRPFSEIRSGAAMAQTGAAPAPLAGARVIDLTHPFEASTLYWPTSPSTFVLTPLSHERSEGGYYYAANTFSAPEHGGTHLDAPSHFAEGGVTAGRIPVADLVGPAVVIDVTREAAADSDYRLTVEDVRAWESAHGRIPKGAIVLMRTGWGKRWPDRARYFGDDQAGRADHLHFPSYGEDAAGFLIRLRTVAALGVDTASIDVGPSQDFLVHRLAGAAGVPGLENIANLEELPETGAFVVALPMKIAEGTGAPLRIVAFLPR